MTRALDDVARPPGEPPEPSRPPAAPPPLSAADPPVSRTGWGVPLAVLIVGMFMSILDMSIVNVAIPAIQKDFGVTTQEIQWITTSYTLCLGVVVPASAWLSDRVGLTRLYFVALAAFAAASALCGMAWDLESMVAFRILQAIPGGLIPVATMSILYKIVPPESIGRAMGLYGQGVVFAPAVGPTLGGYLVEYVDWRLIFYINVPVGVAGLVAAYFLVPRFGGTPGRSFDVLGFLSIGAGLFALLLALSEGEDWGWTSYPVLMLLVGGSLSLALFVVVELEVRQPLLDVRVFRHWAFTNSVLLIAVLSVGLFSVVFFVPLFLQEGAGLTALNAGLTILPQAVVMGVLMPFAGRAYDRFGPRWPALIGLSICAVGTFLLCGINADWPRADVMWITGFRAAGIGIAMMPIMTAGIAALPPSSVGAGSAYNNVAQRVSAAMGLGVLTAFAGSHQAQVMADRSALLRVTDPAVAALAGQGPLGLYPLMQRTQVEVMATTFSDIFMIAGWLTLIGVGLAVFLRSGAARRAPGR
jgi:EmrB/QacA subfamily drug resistance transporter